MSSVSAVPGGRAGRRLLRGLGQKVRFERSYFGGECGGQHGKLGQGHGGGFDGRARGEFFAVVPDEHWLGYYVGDAESGGVISR